MEAGGIVEYMTYQKIKYIDDSLDDTAKLLSIAEEAAEVSQAALKVARASGAVFNPTPVTIDQAEKKLQEELKDLLIVLLISGFNVEELLEEAMDDGYKINRWASRIKEAKKNE